MIHFNFKTSLTVAGRKQFRQVRYLWDKKAIHTHALVAKYNYLTRYFWKNNLCLDNRDELSGTQQTGMTTTLLWTWVTGWVPSFLWLLSCRPSWRWVPALPGITVGGLWLIPSLVTVGTCFLSANVCHSILFWGKEEARAVHAQK